MRPWRFPGSQEPRDRYEAYLRAFAEFLRYAVERGYSPLLFAHSLGPHAHEDDRIALRAAREISSVGERVILIDGEYDCRQIKALYGKMDYMVCTRFHSAIFAISQGIPCLAVSYQGYKAGGIMGEIGLENFVLPIDNISPATLISAFEKLRAEEDAVKAKMKKYMTGCREELDRFSRLAAAELSVPPRQFHESAVK
jgi:colanic acid/amylovoran biosynthesis protein